MKRDPTQPTKGKRRGDIKLDLTKDQLAGIGAVAIAYNNVETAIDRVFGLALNVHAALMTPLASRINGIDGKIELIKLAVEVGGPFDEPLRHMLGDTLGELGFKLLKQCRDGVVHSRVVDAAVGIGERVERRGRITETLLTIAALDGLYAHLRAMSAEINAWTLIFLTHNIHKRLADDDPEKERFALETEASCAQYRLHRTYRLSLPPLPKFPSESEVQAAHAQWQKERDAELMAALLTGPPPQPPRFRDLSPALRSAMGIQGPPPQPVKDKK